MKERLPRKIPFLNLISYGNNPSLKSTDFKDGLFMVGKINKNHYENFFVVMLPNSMNKDTDANLLF